MYQVVEQARDEKLAMYMKLTKRDLAAMLVNCNATIAARQTQPDNRLQFMSDDRTYVVSAA